MEPIDVIIIVLAVSVVVGFIAYKIWQKKTGRSSGCGCGCDCGSCSGCPSVKKREEK